MIALILFHEKSGDVVAMAYKIKEWVVKDNYGIIWARDKNYLKAKKKAEQKMKLFPTVVKDFPLKIQIRRSI